MRISLSIRFFCLFFLSLFDSNTFNVLTRGTWSIQLRLKNNVLSPLKTRYSWYALAGKIAEAFIIFSLLYIPDSTVRENLCFTASTKNHYILAQCYIPVATFSHQISQCTQAASAFFLNYCIKFIQRKSADSSLCVK